MKMAGISERELAALSDIHRSTINNKLNGYNESKFTAEEIEKIASVFVVNEKYLYE